MVLGGVPGRAERGAGGKRGSERSEGDVAVRAERGKNIASDQRRPRSRWCGAPLVACPRRRRSREASRDRSPASGEAGGRFCREGGDLQPRREHPGSGPGSHPAQPSGSPAHPGVRFGRACSPLSAWTPAGNRRPGRVKRPRFSRSRASEEANPRPDTMGAGHPHGWPQ